jgi:hypothetical protein
MLQGSRSVNIWVLSLVFIMFACSLVDAQNEETHGLTQTLSSGGDSAIVSSVLDGTDGNPSSASVRVNVAAQAKPLKKQKRESAEDQVFDFDRRPHLLLLPSFRLNGAGFAPASVAIGGGFSFEPRHFILEGLATYNTARKSNDGTDNNRKGHIRSLNGQFFYRLPNYWFFGGEYGWGQLSTTNYKKQGGSPAFGGGRDLVFRDREVNARFQVTYSPSAFDHANGSQGLNLAMYLSSPLSQKRITYYQLVGMMFGHATITDPTDLVLTARQKADRFHTASVIFGVRMRF